MPWLPVVLAASKSTTWFLERPSSLILFCSRLALDRPMSLFAKRSRMEVPLNTGFFSRKPIIFEKYDLPEP